MKTYVDYRSMESTAMHDLTSTGEELFHQRTPFANHMLNSPLQINAILRTTHQKSTIIQHHHTQNTPPYYTLILPGHCNQILRGALLTDNLLYHFIHIRNSRGLFDLSKCVLEDIHLIARLDLLQLYGLERQRVQLALVGRVRLARACFVGQLDSGGWEERSL